jgi:asparagine synthase (glutamine-hydrolysing)
MCGIAGKLNFDPDHTLDKTIIHQMNRMIRHRGPDDEGVWVQGSVGLGQRRLAIIDLSPTGHQPMSNEDGTIWITFNGEIYNHLDLRADLERRGHCYRGTSDTETIIHLYEEYGYDCVKHLQGMFAFAIWDSRRHCLLLARDRFGQKPLLYAETDEGLTFASEIKALLQDPAVSGEVNEVALHHYLTYGYIPAPMTAFRQICKLPPASLLCWEKGRLSVERYWALSYTPKLDIGQEEAAEQLLNLLRQATHLRLMSDVPLGAFLSGGIDSSAIVALMAEATSAPVKTFSIGFDDESFNELHYARQVAERYATNHHEFIVTPDAMAVLPELVWAYGEPYADSSALPTYYVSRETRQYVTVALNGDGGDEAFAGYDRYLATRLAVHYEKVPRWLREGVISRIVRHLPESSNRKDFLRRLKRFVTAIDTTPERRYARWIVLLTNSHKMRLYTPDFCDRMGMVDSLTLLEQTYAMANGVDFVERTQFVDIHTYLPDDLLVKLDIATMIHSLEGRSPFLDHKLAEFAARLPINYKLQGRTSKYILKYALRNHLPVSILHRDKQGFGVPVARWFRQEMRQVAYEVLLDPQAVARGMFDGVAVKAMLDEHVSGQVNHWHRIWGLLMLELWFRTYVDRSREALSGPAEGIL